MHTSTQTTHSITPTSTLTCWWPLKSLRNFGHVHYNSLDAVALAFNLSHQGGHLVAIEGITVLPINVQQSHGAVMGVTSRVTAIIEKGVVLLSALAGQEMAKS